MITPTDYALGVLEEEFEVFYTDRLVKLIRGGEVQAKGAELARREAFETFVLTKLAALQVATGTAPTP